MKSYLRFLVNIFNYNVQHFFNFRGKIDIDKSINVDYDNIINIDNSLKCRYE